MINRRHIFSKYSKICYSCPWYKIGVQFKLMYEYGVYIKKYDWRTKSQKISDALKRYYNQPEYAKLAQQSASIKMLARKLRSEINDTKRNAQSTCRSN
jgi:hypothetical protein